MFCFPLNPLLQPDSFDFSAFGFLFCHLLFCTESCIWPSFGICSHLFLMHLYYKAMADLDQIQQRYQSKVGTAPRLMVTYDSYALHPAL